MKNLILFLLLTICSPLYAEDIYRLNAKIGENLFNDIFIYEGCVPANVKGSITVPGVFTSRIEDGECQKTSDEEIIKFKIKVNENNQEYYVSYLLSIKGDLISGSMIMDNEILGTFKGAIIFRGAK